MATGGSGSGELGGFDVGTVGDEPRDACGFELIDDRCGVATDLGLGEIDDHAHGAIDTDGLDELFDGASGDDLAAKLFGFAHHPAHPHQVVAKKVSGRHSASFSVLSAQKRQY